MAEKIELSGSLRGYRFEGDELVLRVMANDSPNFISLKLDGDTITLIGSIYDDISDRFDIDDDVEFFDDDIDE